MSDKGGESDGGDDFENEGSQELDDNVVSFLKCHLYFNLCLISILIL